MRSTNIWRFPSLYKITNQKLKFLPPTLIFVCFFFSLPVSQIWQIWNIVINNTSPFFHNRLFWQPLNKCSFDKLPKCFSHLGRQRRVKWRIKWWIKLYTRNLTALCTLSTTHVQKSSTRWISVKLLTKSPLMKQRELISFLLPVFAYTSS